MGRVGDMSKRGSIESNLDMEFADPEILVSTRDNVLFELLSVEFNLQEEAWDREQAEKIVMGWGDTPSGRIPNDWRTRRGPERKVTKEGKQAVSRAQKLRHKRGVLRGPTGKFAMLRKKAGMK